MFDYDIEKELKEITINYRRFMGLTDICDKKENKRSIKSFADDHGFNDEEIYGEDTETSEMEEEKTLDDRERARDINNT